MGLSPEDYAVEPVALWLCNLPIFRLWQVVGDQWRVGPGGPVSLDLVPVMHELDRKGLSADEYDEWLLLLKAMAAAALKAITDD